jgi:uncharacterized NAD(P)/FAD-binding protein YdhS
MAFWGYDCEAFLQQLVTSMIINAFHICVYFYMSSHLPSFNWEIIVLTTSHEIPRHERMAGNRCDELHTLTCFYDD